VCEFGSGSPSPRWLVPADTPSATRLGAFAPVRDSNPVLHQISASEPGSNRPDCFALLAPRYQGSYGAFRPQTGQRTANWVSNTAGMPTRTASPLTKPVKRLAVGSAARSQTFALSPVAPIQRWFAPCCCSSANADLISPLSLPDVSTSCNPLSMLRCVKAPSAAKLLASQPVPPFPARHPSPSAASAPDQRAPGRIDPRTESFRPLRRLCTDGRSG
jgi:hypothetical protein